MIIVLVSQNECECFSIYITMDDQVNPKGAVVMTGEPVKPDPGNIPPEVPPVPQPFSDTETFTVQSEKPFVVSPAVTPENPFVPRSAPEAGSGQTGTESTPVAVAASGKPWLKRLFIIIALIALAGLLIAGGKFALGFISGGQVVSISYWGLWENDTTMKSIITAFESKNPKIKVLYTKQSPRQYRERLQAAIQRNEGPDVYRFHNTWVPMLRNELSAAPKTVITAAEFSSAFYPVATADLVGGQYVYGIPVMIDGLGLYYNEDLFAGAGVSVPVTWEDVLNSVPKLTVRSENTILTSAIALGTTGNVENFSDILAVMLMQNGATLIAPVGKQAEEALLFYRKFSNPSDPVYTWNDSMDNSVYAFASGKVAMILAPSWRVFDVKQINPNLRFKVTSIPQLPGNSTTWASYWAEGVNTKSKNQEQAWQFVKYLTSKEVVTQLYTEAAKTRLFGEPYARVDLAGTISEDPYAGAYVKQGQSAKSFPLASRTFDNGINDKLIKYLEDAVNAVGAGVSPTAALDTAANGFRQVLGSYGLTTDTAPSTPQ
jgi:multiple sugar transport system substrate-binding protein